jgi:hypothetical protein
MLPRVHSPWTAAGAVPSAFVSGTGHPTFPFCSTLVYITPANSDLLVTKKFQAPHEIAAAQGNLFTYQEGRFCTQDRASRWLKPRKLEHRK